MACPNPEPLKLDAVTAGGGEAQQSFGTGVASDAAGEQQTPRKALAVRKERACTAKERISRMQPCAAGKRSSIYRGVTRYASTLSSPPSLPPNYRLRAHTVLCALRMVPWFDPRSCMRPSEACHAVSAVRDLQSVCDKGFKEKDGIGV
jgi:hypothetical protein